MNENGKYVVREIELGRWAIDFVTPNGTASGYGTFPTQEVAVQEARRRNPEITIEIQPLLR